MAAWILCETPSQADFGQPFMQQFMNGYRNMAGLLWFDLASA
jgi:hypothetical protein